MWATCFALPATTAAPTLSDQEAKGFAACQAYSTAVLNAPDSFTEEWKAWAIVVMSTALASPMNDDWSPFRDNPAYVEYLKRFRAEFETEAKSSASPAYVRAYEECMLLRRSLAKKSGQP
jgi:hypothetical protein